MATFVLGLGILLQTSGFVVIPAMAGDSFRSLSDEAVSQITLGLASKWNGGNDDVATGFAAQIFSLPEFKKAGAEDKSGKAERTSPNLKTVVPVKPKLVKTQQKAPVQRPVTASVKTSNQSPNAIEQPWSNWSEAELISSQTLARLAVRKEIEPATIAVPVLRRAVPEAVPVPAAKQPQSAATVALVPVRRKLAHGRSGRRLASTSFIEKPQLLRAPVVGTPLFMRIFKEEAELELWMQVGSRFQIFKTYPICKFSGHLGPKLKTGDHQAPEGFYFVGANQLNPYSSNYRAFNLGFPNLYDRSVGRTGSFLMVHGGCGSVGCYAITDKHIGEVYALAEAALAEGQKAFQVQAFPFRMTAKNMKRHSRSRWFGFWQNLKVGYDAFELTKTPPLVSVLKRSYVFATPPTSSQRRLAYIKGNPGKAVVRKSSKKKQLALKKRLPQKVISASRKLALKPIDPYRVTAIRLSRQKKP